tara:strand:- start:315 stop:1424 length:1110 start_codon:yes stop_codon:yes gene_type:complete
MTNVPFNELSRIHKPILEESLRDFKKVVLKSGFVLNDEIKDFENEYASYSGQNYAVSCANGTDALEIILRSLNIGKNDEVIIPNNSFIATAIAVSKAGATPIFVDNDEFYLIDTTKIENAITSKSKAIIAVNLYGQMADLIEINKIAKKNKLHVIEDAAQSHGAKNKKNINVGDLSTAAAYSFYPGKNLGAWGDGGMVTTNSKSLYSKMLKIRNYGSTKKYVHDEMGFNSRLQPIQGIVLSKKLKKLNSWNDERRFIAEQYNNAFADNKKIQIPETFDENLHVWHLYVIQVSNRNAFIDDLEKNNVQSIIHYPIPINQQKAYKTHKLFNNKFEKSTPYAKRIVSLPIFPEMTKKEINKVIDVVTKVSKK